MAEVRKGFSWFSLAALILAIMACFGIGWSAFVKPTTTNRVADGGTLNQVFNYDVPKVPLMSGGCMRLKADLYWQNDPKSSVVGKKVEEKK